MNLLRFDDGTSTWFGQADTHNWQAVQCAVKFFALKDPGGVIGANRSGAFLSMILAKPPSTFFSWAFNTAEVANRVERERKLRRAAGLFSVPLPFIASASFFKGDWNL